MTYLDAPDSPHAFGQCLFDPHLSHLFHIGLLVLVIIFAVIGLYHNAIHIFLSKNLFNSALPRKFVANEEFNQFEGRVLLVYGFVALISTHGLHRGILLKPKAHSSLARDGINGFSEVRLKSNQAKPLARFI